jgi:hypothetical protein
MKNKIKNILIITLFIGIVSDIMAQEYAIDKRATIIAGTSILTLQGGDLFNNSEGKGVTNFSFTPTVNHFVTKNLFIGLGVGFSSVSQGDYRTKAFGIGPQLGYAFGESTSTAFPFLDLGIRYYKNATDYGVGNTQRSGSDISLGFGFIFPVKNHIGIIFEGGYHLLKLDSNSGNFFSMGIGIAGLIF